MTGYRSQFLTSDTVTRDYLVQVDRPVMSPNEGFFPDGTVVSLSVLRPDATIHYTISGADPTESDPLYTGPFPMNQVFTPGADLSIVKARAFAPNTVPSEIVTGESVRTNSIGLSRDAEAGIGSTVLLPVVTSLRSNAVLRSIQFRVEIWPVANAVPLTNELEALPITTNDFVTVPTPTESGAPAEFYYSPYHNGTTNGLMIWAIGPESGLIAQDSRVVAQIKVPVSPEALEGQSYHVQVVQASGTSDGQQQAVPLMSQPARTLTITNRLYLVGDSSPGSWYNAGDFGNGELDNSDVNNVFNASLGLRLPPSFTDAFDAMDAYPPDSSMATGGDGEIRYLDWQYTLMHALRLNTNNWARRWGPGGIHSSIFLGDGLPMSVESQSRTKSVASSLPGSVWVRQATLMSQPINDAHPGSVYDLPVIVNVGSNNSLSGLSFRAVLGADAGGPAVTEMQFIPANSIPMPLQSVGLGANELLCGWPLVPTASFVPALQGSNVIGSIRFQVPNTALGGQAYTLHFVKPDGASDLLAQIDMESFPALVSVGTTVPAPTAKISDEWKVAFFGSLTDPRSDAAADPDGDGVPNSQEFLAGTNPTNALSRLHLMAPHWNDGASSIMRGWVLNWLSAPSKTYVIDGKSSLTGNTWKPITAPIPGTGADCTVIDTNALAPTQFYRVRIQ